MITLENGRVRLTLSAEFGGRITELVDLRTGRNWLVGGPMHGSTAQNAVFGVDQARGWDECFPSIAPCRAASWAMPLRDHGELWARPLQVSSTADSISVEAAVGATAFRRTCRLDEDRVYLAYEVENAGDTALSYLWSQHMLLDLRPGETIDLPGIDTAEAAFLTHRGAAVAGGSIDFPLAGRGLPPLDVVQPLSERFAAKLFAPVSGPFVASLGGAQGRLEMSWHGKEAGYLGLWLDHGGWPDDNPVGQVCLAPTTAPYENLETAVSNGAARTLAPSQRHRWSVALRLLASEGTIQP